MSNEWAEHAARAFDQFTSWDTPGELALDLNPSLTQTKALTVIDAVLVKAATTPNARVIITMPPQEGKSERASRAFPLWMLLRNPDCRIGIASYESTLAMSISRRIRDDIRSNGHRLGLSIREDKSAQQEWEIAGHVGGVYATGVGSALTGRPLDMLIIDDPVKDRTDANSPTMRQRNWDWWTDVAATRLAPGAPVILIMTRWHHDDLAGRLLEAEDGGIWEVVNIPAQADSAGDLLGRKPGTFLKSARGRTRKEWEAIKKRSGSRTWNALYQGRPTPDKGDIFPRDWQRYEQAIWLEAEDGTRTIPGSDVLLIQSWDMTFKDTKTSDYVVGMVLAAIGSRVFIVDMVRDRLSFTQTVAAVERFTARWPQSHAKLIEDTANGPAVISSLSNTVPGLIPITPRESKVARAVAITPFVEAGNVVLPAANLLPIIEEFVEEAVIFPNGAHDDTVDALTQGLAWLYLDHPIPDSVVYPAEFVEHDALGYTISPY